VAFRVVDGVGAGLAGPDADLGYGRAGSLRAMAVGGHVGHRNALHLSYLTELAGSAESGPRGAEHDDAAAIEQQFPVPDGPVAALVAHSLGESEGLDQPVHRRAGICVQEVGDDLRIGSALRHGSDHTVRRLWCVIVGFRWACQEDTAPGGTVDITELILDDHREQRRLFAILEQIDRAETGVLSAIWDRLASFLELHAAAEEAIFYPALLQVGLAAHRAAGVEGETLDAIHDHNEIRDAVTEVARHQVGTDEWFGAVAGANLANSDHMAEEEREGLTDFRRLASLQRRHQLAVAFAAYEARNFAGVPAVDKDPAGYIREVEAEGQEPPSGSLSIGSLKRGLPTGACPETSGGVRTTTMSHRGDPDHDDVTWVWLFSGERANATRRVDRKTGISHSGTARTRSYGVDDAIMHIERHERGMHIV